MPNAKMTHLHLDCVSIPVYPFTREICQSACLMSPVKIGENSQQKNCNYCTSLATRLVLLFSVLVSQQSILRLQRAWQLLKNATAWRARSMTPLRRVWRQLLFNLKRQMRLQPPSQNALKRLFAVLSTLLAKILKKRDVL